jgi:YHS domain-containing protein
MKIKILTAAFIPAFLSCHTQTQPLTNNSMVRVDSASQISKARFKGLKYADPRDLSCMMPLVAGVEDTAVYNGKIYGFCSKECKEEFLKNPKASQSKEK